MTIPSSVVVTGAAGQDGYFLSKYLRRAGVLRVTGVVRPGTHAQVGSNRFRWFTDIEEADLADHSTLTAMVAALKPDWILNFGAIASSLTQQQDPLRLYSVNTLAPAAMLEAVRKYSPATLFVQASSSEVFAGGSISPQTLDTPRVPRTIYGATKIGADNLVSVFRNSFGINALSVILYSHESPLRHPHFFSRTIITNALNVLEGRQERIMVHSPDAVRDWGYAGEYCHLLVSRLIAGQYGDFILGSGVRATVRDFARAVCDQLHISYADRVDELPLQIGRVTESLDVIADLSTYNPWPGRAPGYGLPRLIEFLLRFEKHGQRSRIPH